MKGWTQEHIDSLNKKGFNVHAKEPVIKQELPKEVPKTPPKEIVTVQINEPDKDGKQTIYGSCPSKSNCYRIIELNGHSSLGKTSVLKTYEDNFYIQCAKRGKMITGYFEFHMDVFYPTERADLDNSLKVILDCLQKVKVIKNDNKCTKIVVQKFKDVNRPRVEYLIIEV